MSITKSSLLAIAFAAFCLGILGSAHKVSAAAMPYDPNNIIRDDIFTNGAAMSANDIQSFLSSNGSCLAGASPASLGSSGQTAAQIIAQAATSANGGKGINPRVILVILQKEQSLINSSCAQLDARQGSTYALNRAMGYNVPDVLGVGSCMYTFSAQLLGTTCNGDSYMSAPSSLRSNFELNKVGPGGSYPFPQSFSVQQYSDAPGNITINPQTKATALLYRYTPYAYYGNYNFFTIFQAFFGSPVCSTNLNVVQGNGRSESSVLFNGVKYPINGLATLQAWGLDCLPYSVIPQATYDAYPVGSTISRVFKNSEAPEVYIVSGGVRRHISTSLYAGSFGLNGEEVGNLPPSLMQFLPEGPPLGFLVKSSGSPEIYFAQAGVKYYVPNIPTLEAWGFQMSELVIVNATYMNALPTGGNLSTLVKGSGPDIFVASLHNFVYAPSTARLADWNMQSYSVTNIDDPYLQSLPKRGSLSRLTRGTGPDTYYIENKRRYYVKTLNSAIQLERLYGTLTPMSDSAIAALPYSGVK